ncbi:hypothetical protein GCM10022416_34390 [Actinomadura keratinilytica]|uniref:Uncharacterized protein n=1 Tax=Actinomadura keratinilytica TaxID=547461 RepID=A0ABP7YZ52_9ACTN
MGSVEPLVRWRRSRGDGLVALEAVDTALHGMAGLAAGRVEGGWTGCGRPPRLPVPALVARDRDRGGDAMTAAT